jgi:histidinol-phosphate aminotransferase
MLVKPNIHIEKLDAYKITPQEPWIEKERDSILKLDWNEGTNLPEFICDFAQKLLRSGKYYNWYPDYSAIELHQQISQWLNLSVMQILSFPGSDSALDAICRCYLDMNSTVALLTPSYDNFRVFARSVGASVVHIKIPKPYEFDVNYVIEEVLSKKAKLLYLVSPNNPCGYVITPSEMTEICRRIPEVLIVCDHAYIEFCPDSDCTHLIVEHDNLVIARTFSKAFSLAGLRVGYVVAQHHILEVLAKVRNGKNLNMLSQKIVIEYLKNIEYLYSWVKEVTTARELLYSGFRDLKINYYNSHANFVLFEPKNPQNILAELKSENIYIRDKSVTTEGGIRITVTDSDAMQKFISSLKLIILGKKNDLHLNTQSLL